MACDDAERISSIRHLASDASLSLTCSVAGVGQAAVRNDLLRARIHTSPDALRHRPTRTMKQPHKEEHGSQQQPRLRRLDRAAKVQMQESVLTVSAMTRSELVQSQPAGHALHCGSARKAIWANHNDNNETRSLELQQQRRTNAKWC